MRVAALPIAAQKMKATIRLRTPMTSRTSILHVRVDDQLKTEAAERLSSVGLTISDAVRILLTRVAREGRFPRASRSILMPTTPGFERKSRRPSRTPVLRSGMARS
jgi:addiction module RelB/DinJ family antitoxin